MTKHRLLAFALALGAVFAPDAPAQALPEEWAFCDSCSTQADFSGAARSWLGSRIGTYELMIGNTQSGTLYHVSITASNGPIVPNRLRSPAPSASGAVVAQLLPAKERLSVKPATGAAATKTASHTYINWALRQSAQTEAQFRDVLFLAKSEIIVAVDPGTAASNPGFAGFTGGSNEVISPYLWTRMSEQRPGWQTGGINGGAMSMLWQSLKSLFGKGPKACLVFGDGDVACYQLNMLDKNAALYLEGTAYDRAGNPISPSGGGGDGVGITPQGNTSVRYGPSRGGWLICSFVSGRLSHCYILPE